ncbi:MAG: NifB/NifX family molybdenum-iron cluster-binding protein [Dehalococcoidia bacterium]
MPTEGQDLEEELLIAFATDDEENLNDDHLGMARYFHVYRFCSGEAHFVEKRKNAEFTGDESMKHGDPEKARTTSSVLQGVDAVVGRKFGPNLPRLLKKFVCVLVRTDGIDSAIEAVHSNMGRVYEEKSKQEDRRHIVLKV